ASDHERLEALGKPNAEAVRPQTQPTDSLARPHTSFTPRSRPRRTLPLPMRIPAALAVVALALGLAATAAAASRPLVPSAAQARITAAAPTLAYIPTRLGFGYRYARWARSPGTVRIWFRNRAGKQILFTAA